VTAAIKGHGRLSFTHALKVLGGHRTARWAGAFSIVQRGDGATRKLTGQGYVLVKLSAHASLCLAGTASGRFTGAPFKGHLTAVGGKGFGARIRGTGAFSLRLAKPVVNGRLKLRSVHKALKLPKPCRALA
jgi:hypothetical protein